VMAGSALGFAGAYAITDVQQQCSSVEDNDGTR